jgi:dipeptidyl aminopeptidase/acylaminoacyl peptidase
MTETKRPITADDLLTLQNVGDPQISPDGARVAFVRTVTDLDKNKYRGEIWLVPADGSGPPCRFTGGKDSAGEPRWSPDGARLAFVSDREDEAAQVFIIPADGGEALALTHLEPGSVQGLRWSPDGAKIAFLYRATPQAYTKKAVEERKTKGLSDPPRVHTRLFYRLDGFGYFDGSYPQVYVADVATGEAKPLTGGEFGCSDIAWSPDGQTLAFLSDRRPDGDALGLADEQIWTVPVGGGDLTQIPAPRGEKGGLCWSLDGQTFAYTGNPNPADQWGTNNSRVFLLPVGGGETARDLTGHTDKAVGTLTIADVGGAGGEALAWSADGARLFFPVSENGDTRVYSISSMGGDDGKLTPLTPAGRVVGGFSVAGGALAYTLGSPTLPAEVFVNDRQVSDLNQAWVGEIALQPPTPFALDNGAGGTVPGWFLLPPGHVADGTAPLVLYVHGGPHLQYGNTLFHELQWLAAQGYVVAYANPRGSKGYGEAHTKAIKGDWGGPALADMERVADEAIARGYCDPSKTAIMGGSYGGYLTAWAVGHTDRFACAVADRLVGSLPSMSGTSDFPWSHGTYYGGNAWDDPADLWRHSPQAYAGQIHTPLLLIHSDGDLRCPIGQAEELFAALRLQRKPVEFVRYPASTSHGLSRNGLPDLRLDRLRRNLAWLDKYLKAEAGGK